MAGFLTAHGYASGPAQRPLRAGAICGALAVIPATGILFLFGSLALEELTLHLELPLTIGGGAVLMTAAGAFYSWLFGRAANARHGGWLFGLAFGFAIWAAGAGFVLPLLTGGRALAGPPATGVLFALLVWGFATGLMLPFVHPYLHERLESASKRPSVGPQAVAPEREQRPRAGRHQPH